MPSRETKGLEEVRGHQMARMLTQACETFQCSLEEISVLSRGRTIVFRHTPFFDEVEQHVVDKLTGMVFPVRILPVALSTPQFSTHRISFALTRLRARDVIEAQSARDNSGKATVWAISFLHPRSKWKAR